MQSRIHKNFNEKLYNIQDRETFQRKKWLQYHSWQFSSLQKSSTFSYRDLIIFIVFTTIVRWRMGLAMISARYWTNPQHHNTCSTRLHLIPWCGRTRKLSNRFSLFQLHNHHLLFLHHHHALVISRRGVTNTLSELFQITSMDSVESSYLWSHISRNMVKSPQSPFEGRKFIRVSCPRTWSRAAGWWVLCHPPSLYYNPRIVNRLRPSRAIFVPASLGLSLRCTPWTPGKGISSHSLEFFGWDRPGLFDLHIHSSSISSSFTLFPIILKSCFALQTIR